LLVVTLKAGEQSGSAGSLPHAYLVVAPAAWIMGRDAWAAGRVAIFDATAIDISLGKTPSWFCEPA